jgi:hypothetical protein
MFNFLDQYKLYFTGGLILLLVVFFFLWRLNRNERINLEKEKARLEASIQAQKDESNKGNEVEKVAADFPIPKLRVYDPNLPKHFKTGGTW